MHFTDQFVLILLKFERYFFCGIFFLFFLFLHIFGPYTIYGMVVSRDRQHNGQNMKVKYFSPIHVVNVDVPCNYVKSQPTRQKHIPRHMYETIYTSNEIIYALYN